MKHENAVKRGHGDIGGPALPNGGLEGGLSGITGLDKSLPEFDRSNLPKGYTDMGSIKGATHSDPIDKRPGTNNRKARI
jgi:hypothetical protein